MAARPSNPSGVTGALRTAFATVFAVASAVAVVLAAWLYVALAQSRSDLEPLAQPVLFAGAMAVIVPLALSAWRHDLQPGKVMFAMTYMPLVTNATIAGLLAQVVPTEVAHALREHGADVAAQTLGEGHTGTRRLSGLSYLAAENLDPAPAAALPSRPAIAALATEKTLRVPFLDEGTAIIMDAHLSGPLGEITVPYLFDTGASYTTLSTDTAQRLGIEVPADAPTLRFNTAAGRRESRMVYLPQLRLGDVKIEGLLVSVCDTCVNHLLGLNVMREFLVQLDYKRKIMDLIPRISEDDPNRAYDVEPVVELGLGGRAEVWLGGIRWTVTVKNRSTRTLRNLVPRVKFDHGAELLGTPIESIAPGEVGRSRVEGRIRVGSANRDHQYTLTLAEAHW